MKDISQDNPEIVESLKDRIITHFQNLRTKFNPKDNQVWKIEIDIVEKY